VCFYSFVADTPKAVFRFSTKDGFLTD